jgi:hypothetical protein
MAAFQMNTRNWTHTLSPDTRQKQTNAHGPRPREWKQFDQSKSDDKPSKLDDKLSDLISYRKAKGLYFKCGGKWGPQHKCPAIVPLHMIEEVWHLIAEADGVSPIDPQSRSDFDPDASCLHWSTSSCDSGGFRQLPQFYQ